MALEASLEGRLKTIDAQAKRIQKLGDMLTEYQRILFCAATAKSKEGGLVVDLRNSNRADCGVIRFNQSEESPNLIIITAASATTEG